MSTETVPTFFSVAATALWDRLGRSPAGYGTRPDELYTLLGDPGILQTAVAHAVQELVWTAVQAQMDEEARTASFMGHLASNLNWYALLARWTADLFPDVGAVRPCNLFWAQQAKHVEVWRGADFGVAIREQGDEVRIALYQAKRCDAKGVATLLRDVGDRRMADQKMKENRDDADAGALRAPGKDDGLPRLHQVHRLETWRRRGLTHLRRSLRPDLADHPWCRYVFWHDVQATDPSRGANCPTTRSARSCFDAVRKNLLAGSPRPFIVEVGREDFGLEICTRQDADLVVPAKDAKDLLGRMKNLNMPDFIGVDETGDSGGALQYWRELFSGSGKVVSHVAGSGLAAMTPQLLPPAASPAPTP